MAMSRTTAAFVCALLLVAAGCSEGDRLPPGPVNCAVADAYEFLNISGFEASDEMGGWYCYGDPTPGSVPDPEGPPDTDGGAPTVDCGELVVNFVNDNRCGDTRVLKLEAQGHNFWGAGFGDWEHNQAANRAPDGTNYEGISFWVRSAPNRNKTFLLRVDDGRTIVLNREVAAPPVVTNDDPLVSEDNFVVCEDPGRPQAEPGDWDLDGDGCLGLDDIPKCEDHLLPQAEPGDHDVNGDGCLGPGECRDPLVPQAQPTDEDLDGDGCLGPGDIVAGTECRLPPPQELGDPPCYRGGVDRPGTVSRVPAPNECGNYFHTFITVTERWQLMLIPWSTLVQWPCPNRIDGGVNRADIAGFKIEFIQGTHYEVWIDNIAFYRLRAGAGS
jgi:hypothetical protein